MPRRLLEALLAALATAFVMRRNSGSQPPSQIRPATPPLRSQPLTYAQLRHLVIATVLLILGIWLFFWLASRAGEVLTLLVISGILSVALRPTVDRLDERGLPPLDRGMPRALAIFVIYFVLAGLTVGMLLIVVPQLVREFQGFISRVPEYLEQIEGMLLSLQQYPFVSELDIMEGELVNQLLGGLSQAVAVLQFAVNAATTVLSASVILVLTFLMLMEAEAIHNHAISLLPISEQPRARQMSARMGTKIAGWLRGIVLLSLFIGITTGIAMWALGMPYPLLLALAAGMFEFLPMVGAYLGAAPAVALALFQPTWVLVAVIVFFFLIQQIENNVLAPMIMGHEVEMPPLLVIVAILIGAALMGIVGALLAVPVTAIVQVVWTDLVVQEIRKRQRATQGDE